MIWYLFTAIGFPPGSNGRQTCTEIGNRQQKRNNTQNNTKSQNTQIRKQKYKTKKPQNEYQKT